ncbi:MAG: hypothetical protein KGY39_01430 [Anaerolineales bacterium]|nr:hypothetical protein [Anaerolineales bacterium]MBS3753226.1 hypothetical protein [Anaerolineales bacterium]
MYKKLITIFGLLIVASLALAACQPAEPETVVETVIVEKEGETIVETVEVEKEARPTPTGDRRGGKLDTVIYTEETSDTTAVERLKAGNIDIYAYTVSNPELFSTVEEAEELAYTLSYGSYNELSFNTTGPEWTGEDDEFIGFNPFANKKIREAMNWLVDRDFIAEEIYGGLSKPRYTALNTAFPDYAKVAGVAAKIETKYAYDLEKAKEVIATEMEDMGATMGPDGFYQYNDETVAIDFLIRTEDERRDIGDYVANQLEEAGIKVNRLYKTSSEAATFWVQSDPNEGSWHLYTGGWISNFVNRDLGGNFEFFFTPRGYSLPLWQNYEPGEEFDDLALKLANNNFTSLQERTDMIARALELSMQESQRIFLVDNISYTPRRAETVVAADLSAAVAGSRINPYVMGFEGQMGGSMTISMPSILTEPWNPVGGTNWVYDAAVQRPTMDYGMQVDPYTGLRLPQRIESAEVVIQEDLPVGRGSDASEDWLALETAAEISVPEDAWVDWDAEAQEFITVGEKFPDGLTALQKTTITYPADLFDITWHDGSSLSMGDFVFGMIMTFDPGKEASPIFDSSQAAPLEAFLQNFKGVKVVSEDPLVIETYTDSFALEAELIDQISGATWWPNYAYGPGSWHSIGLGWKAEASGELGFTSAKADEMETEWMNYIGGPSLEILEKHLMDAMSENFIPYEPTLGEYVSAEEAETRWENYQDWYESHDHFWIGTGPYYLDEAFPVEGTVIVKQNPYFPDVSTRWAGFAEPKIAEAEVDGPGRVTTGEEASFDVFITFEGEAYPMSELSFVKYLVFDANDELVFQGEAEAVEDGLYNVTLTAEQTGELESGANKLQVAVSSTEVAIPTFADFEFVTE